MTKGGAVAARAGLRVGRAVARKTLQSLQRLGGGRLGKVAKAISGKTHHLRNKVRGLAHRLKRPKTNRTLGRSAEPRCCLVAGTLVATELGLRPIEEIEVGDRVWARDEETGEIALQPVAELFVTPSQETLELELESSDGTIETLGATYGHPFWVDGQGWTPAGELVAGDVLFTERDGWLRVRQVRGSPGVRTVYNLEVKEDHNYFVGRTRAWVHNKLCEEGKNRLSELRRRREQRLAGNEAGSSGSGFKTYASRDREIQKNLQLDREIRAGGPRSPLVPGGGLAAHEKAGGHTIAKHIGKTDADLLDRLSDQPGISGASTFSNRAIAESAVGNLLTERAEQIQGWLTSLGNKLVLNGQTSPIGRYVAQGTTAVREVSGLRVVLRRDDALGLGYRIQTSFPTP